MYYARKPANLKKIRETCGKSVQVDGFGLTPQMDNNNNILIYKAQLHKSAQSAVQLLRPVGPYAYVLRYCASSLHKYSSLLLNKSFHLNFGLHIIHVHSLTCSHCYIFHYLSIYYPVYTCTFNPERNRFRSHASVYTTPTNPDQRFDPD